jgi:ribose 5-phosphate isomerase B
MKIAVGSAVKGFLIKSAVKKHLEAQGHEIIDVGCYDTTRFIKYTSVGERIARALQSGAAELAINCCGSGTGASLSAGKFKNVCAVSCESVKTATLIRVVNGANCLCMGEDIVTPELACEMADAFINSTFQDAPAVPQNVRDFWLKARDEMLARGVEAGNRELEGLS